MDAKHKLHKKQTTTFDYEEEMEKALSTIFRNLRGIEEMRFRITSNRAGLDPELQKILNVSTSEPSCIGLHHNLSELSGLQDQEHHVEKPEQCSNDISVPIKAKRRSLPVIPQARSLSQ